MRRKLYIIVGLAVALLLFLVLIFATRNKGSTNPCPQFISYIEAGNAKDSYALFSKDTKTSYSLKQWTTSVNNMKTTFNNAKAAQQSSTINFDAKKSDRAAGNIRYNVTAGGDTYNLQCFLTPVGSGYQISGFTSQRQIP